MEHQIDLRINRKEFKDKLGIKDGETPSDEKLVTLIKPLIPKVQDGKTPSKDELVDIIKPLIPEPLKGKDGSPDKPEEIVAKLRTVKKTWLPIDAIEGDWSTKIPRAANNFYTKRIEELIDVDLSGVTKVGDKYVLSTGSSTDEKVKLNASDPTAGYLDAKLQEGIQQVQFDTTPSTTITGAGQMQWNATEETLDLGMPDNVTLQIGQEVQLKARNNTVSTILNGRPVYSLGMLGNRPTIALAKADAESTGKVLGLATQDILSNADGKITTFGYVRNIDTTGTPFGETWADGDTLWVSKTTAGYLTKTEPAVPHHSDVVGQVVNAHQTQGSILVNIRHHRTMEELSDVDGTPLTTSGQFPVWNQTGGYFDFNYNITNYTPLNNTTTFLKLDQTTPQTIINGAPIFNLGLKTGYVYPTADSTTAFQFRKANGTTAVMTVDTTNERIGIGNAAPTEKLEVTGNLYFASENTGVIVDTSGSKRTGFMKYSGFAGAFVHGNTVPLQIGMVNQTAVTGGTFTPQMSIETNGNVSIGNFTATAVLDVNGSANAGSASLRLRGGDGGTAPADAYQILLSYTGAATYTHNIRTRHSGGTPNENAIDFYTWNQGVDTTTTIGTKHVMTLTGAGRVGIGTTNPSSLLHVSETRTATGVGNYSTLNVVSKWNPTTTDTTYFQSAGNFELFAEGASNISGHLGLRGFRVVTGINGNYSGTVSSVAGFTSTIFNVNGGTITSGYGFRIEPPIGTSTITNLFGVYIAAQKAASVGTAYAIYCNGASDPSYFAGAVGIGTTSPGAAPFSAKLAVVGPITSIQDVDWNGIYVGADTTRYAAYAWRNVSNRAEFYTRGYVYPIYLNNALWINQNSGGTDGKIGINTQSPSARLHIIDTTEQLRLGYDASNYLSATVASTGSTTFALTGTTPIFTFSQAVKVGGGLQSSDGSVGLSATYNIDGSAAGTVATMTFKNGILTAITTR